MQAVLYLIKPFLLHRQSEDGGVLKIPALIRGKSVPVSALRLHCQLRRCPVDNQGMATLQELCLPFRCISGQILQLQVRDFQKLILQLILFHIQGHLCQLIEPRSRGILHLLRRQGRFPKAVYRKALAPAPERQLCDTRREAARVPDIHLHRDRFLPEHTIPEAVPPACVCIRLVFEIQILRIRIDSVYLDTAHGLSSFISRKIAAEKIDTSPEILFGKRNGIAAVLSRAQLPAFLLHRLVAEGRDRSVCLLPLHIIPYACCAALIRQPEGEPVIFLICPFILFCCPGKELEGCRGTVQKYLCLPGLCPVSGSVSSLRRQCVGRFRRQAQGQGADAAFLRHAVPFRKPGPGLPVDILRLSAGRVPLSVQSRQIDVCTVRIQIPFPNGNHRSQAFSSLIIGSRLREIYCRSIRIPPLHTDNRSCPIYADALYLLHGFISGHVPGTDINAAAEFLLRKRNAPEPLLRGICCLLSLRCHGFRAVFRHAALFILLLDIVAQSLHTVFVGSPQSNVIGMAGPYAFFRCPVRHLHRGPLLIAHDTDHQGNRNISHLILRIKIQRVRSSLRKDQAAFGDRTFFCRSFLRVLSIHRVKISGNSGARLLILRCRKCNDDAHPSAGIDRRDVSRILH